MTDTTETPSGAPTDDTRARNKEIIFAALEEAGITKVSIEFDGAGDSGQIEDILAWNADGATNPMPSHCRIGAPVPASRTTRHRDDASGSGRNARLGLSRRHLFRLGDQRRRLRHLRLRYSRPDGHARTQRALHRGQYHQPRILREAAMAHPYHHALASVKKWGGEVSDYMHLHSWFDQSKSIAAISATGLCGITPRAFSCLRRFTVRPSRSRPAA